MAGEREFRIRPGRIRSTRAQSARPFIAQALAAAKKAGGGVSRSGRIVSANRSRFGRGQRASIQANRLITARTRGAVIKARVVRHSSRAAPLGTHLDYLRRDGVTRDGERARLFGPGEGEVDGRAFAERCGDDRHHFRFIVSPDDAVEMSDLRSFTRDLVGQMEKDLGTRLDWAAVDHWNTEHPHVHLIVRGVRDDGQDLVISRDYIKEGMRDRARDLITQELGPRTDLDIRRSLERQVGAERWTNSTGNLFATPATPASSTWRPTPIGNPTSTVSRKSAVCGNWKRSASRNRSAPDNGRSTTRRRPPFASSASAATSSSVCTAPSQSAASSAGQQAMCLRRRASTRPLSAASLRAGWMMN